MVAGWRLSRYADAIAEATGLGRLLIGSVLLAGTTSLPELSVDVAAIRQGAPDLAVGDLLGSGLVNLMILAVLDMTRYSRGTMLSRVAAGHALSATLSISLVAIAGVSLLVERRLGGATFFGLGAGSWLILLGYAYGVRLMFLDQRSGAKTIVEQAAHGETGGPKPRLLNALLFFGISAVAILLAGFHLAAAAQDLAELSGLGTTFVGTSFVAFSTSLPELVTCLAAVRMGAHDLAIGNVFGSNAFNMGILGTLDFWQPGSLLAVVSETHVVTALCLILATGAAVMGQLCHIERRVSWFQRNAVVVASIIIGSLWLVYAMTA